MSLRFAFVGFRHGHIFSLIRDLDNSDLGVVVAACEEDPATRESLAKEGQVKITHNNFAAMLAEVDCDVVAIGDYYARRGPLAIAALEAGKQVVSDKPLCIRLDELDRIEALAAEKRLSVGLQLDLRSSGVIRTFRRLIAEGVIGTVHTVTFTGQHPLNLGSRPGWYFEPGKHGGTINDIGIHGVDAVRWVTGREIADVTAARAWNARAHEFPFFQDGAQFMLQLDNQGGVLADVSYLAPENCPGMPQYWRFTFHGDKGVLEGTYGHSEILLGRVNGERLETIVPDAAEPCVYLHDFCAEIKGKSRPGRLTTADVIAASRWTLKAQACADAETKR